MKSNKNLEEISEREAKVIGEFLGRALMVGQTNAKTLKEFYEEKGIHYVRGVIRNFENDFKRMDIFDRIKYKLIMRDEMKIYNEAKKFQRNYNE